MTTNTHWLYENFHHDSYSTGIAIKRKLHSEQSQYQKIEVFETKSFGNLLTLDGKTMVCDLDEFVYHEVMAHIPYAVLPKCESVLIIGGGDGGIVRELVKHKSIKQIDLVEIDERVVRVCQEFFPDCTSGLSDKRVTTHFADGFVFIDNVLRDKLLYDLVIVDSTDPEDFASQLFTSDFYGKVKRILAPHGILMNQTENPFLDTYGIKNIYANLREHFKNVHSFSAPMLIYPGVFWTFGFSSMESIPTEFNIAHVNELQTFESTLKWYNTNWHQGCFRLSNFHKNIIGI
ncbi:MAG: polyamine aminopropyltransferase [Bacteriovoracaceae bacterium]|nr:polyamine aminopropyltransferase [Bacteriovoracaceae bacterium]